jgi:hypothetical protein
MIQCSIRLFNNDGAEVIETFEFHPELLASPSTKLSFDQIFQSALSRAIAIKMDTYPVLPAMGIKSLASIQETIEILETTSNVLGKEINSPIQVTRLKTKTGWMIVLEGGK